VPASNVVALVILLSIGAVLGWMVAAARRRRPGTTVVVRCLGGHVFTTEWAPSGLFRPLGPVPVRPQHCPVGDHWTVVTPVRPEDLTLGEWQVARRYHE